MHRLIPGDALDDALTPYLDVERPPRPDRPWVLANMVAGIDGSTAVGGRVGELSSPTDRQLFLDLRSVADIVLVGAETARRERYGPVRLDERRRDHRQRQGRPPLPRLALVSRSLELDDASRALTGDPDNPGMVVTCTASPTDRRAGLADGVETVLAGGEQVEPDLALAQLRAQGVEVVLCEGGPALLGALLTAGTVDELCITLAPVIGGDPLPLAVLPAATTPRRARLAHVLEADDQLFLRYELS
ncbi:MAG: pyrimidine reductase family protein [Acidimicrobiales bacterium]|nr:pyrimidine reductase family protein [Acidimicrobiales bacterium]